MKTPAPSLREMQAALAASIESGRDAVPREWLSLPPGVDVAKRVAVHVDGYPARIAEAVKESFPATSHLLGGARFSELLDRYVAALGEWPRNLNDVGRDLPSHLEGDPLGDELPFLADLAAFEWEIHVCFDSAQAPPFDAACGADWSLDDWDRVQILFQPGMRLVRSVWPLRELRDSRDVPREEIDIDLTRTPRSLLVRRDGFEVVSDPIDETEADAIARFLAGDTLGQVMTLVESRGVEADQVAEYFGRWASLGLVASCGPRLR